MAYDFPGLVPPHDKGPDYALNSVRIGPPEIVRCGEADEHSSWFDAARARDDVYHFPVYVGEDLAGEGLLHDVEAGEALVGYRLFEADRRGRGAGPGRSGCSSVSRRRKPNFEAS